MFYINENIDRVSSFYCQFPNGKLENKISKKLIDFNNNISNIVCKWYCNYY